MTPLIRCAKCDQPIPDPGDVRCVDCLNNDAAVSAEVNRSPRGVPSPSRPIDVADAATLETIRQRAVSISGEMSWLLAFVAKTRAALAEAQRERDALGRELRDIEQVLHEVVPGDDLGDMLARKVVDAFLDLRGAMESIAKLDPEVTRVKGAINLAKLALTTRVPKRA